jgi:hypothetical protein
MGSLGLVPRLPRVLLRAGGAVGLGGRRSRFILTGWAAVTHLRGLEVRPDGPTRPCGGGLILVGARIREVRKQETRLPRTPPHKYREFISYVGACLQAQRQSTHAVRPSSFRIVA